MPSIVRRTPLAALPLAMLLLALACAAPTGRPLRGAEPQAGSQPPPLFGHDVQAVLSKAGCNSGPCHGNQNGKGGLKLSLRSQDRTFDFRALARQHEGRRVDRLAPEQSLVLLKATGRIAHLGGKRFDESSPEYRILRDWIAGGAREHPADAPKLVKLAVDPRERTLTDPRKSFSIRAIAHFSDGTQRDVTRLAAYETSNLGASVAPDGVVMRQAFGETTVLVRYLNRQEPVQVAFLPARPDFVWTAPPADNYVDELLLAKLQRLKILPSATADDATFVRRVYLDVLGVLPTADEAREFCADRSPLKRSRLIDRLLERPELADHWALKWCDLLRVEEKVLDARGVERFHGWIREAIARGMPIDRFVRELITARGSTYDNPPANFWRANRDATTRGETTARLFLGVRLQCAQCHNHPFDRWTQDDYYSWAALFARIDYKIVDNKRKDKLDKHEFEGEQLVEIKDSGEQKNARTNKDAAPKFLGADPPTLAPTDDRLAPLADWLVGRDNRRFAESQANFVWRHLMGRGLVEPIDDFRATNPPVNPPLLRALADDLIARDFDLRGLMRSILMSRAYQLSSEPGATNADDDVNFSRAVVRRLPAELLLDAQCQTLDAPSTFTGYADGQRAGRLPGVRKIREREKPASSGDRFLTTFGKPARLLACDCERSDETTLSQAFTLISGDDLAARLARPGNRLHRMAASAATPSELADELYWTALSRPPGAAERAAAVALFAAEPDRLAALQDLAWALLNAKEFLFRR